MDIGTYIMLKFQLSMSIHFGVYSQKSETWTHLPEKLLRKTKKLAAHARDVPIK